MPKIPFRISPMLATLVDAPFSRENWIFEEKYDGIRMLTYKEGPCVSIVSRNNIDRTGRFPLIAQAVQVLKPETLLLDGEIVVFDSKGVSRFQLLQRSSGNPVYMIFDCLYRNGSDLRREPLSLRRSVLKSILVEGNGLRLCEVLAMGDGLEAYRIAGNRGLEGVIGKNLNSRYESRRSREWLKVKIHQQQEFVIGGFTAPKGSREDFGALLLGVYRNSELHYVGKVGTGFDESSLRNLHRKFQPLIQERSPFTHQISHRGKATFLKPKLVAQVSFTEWTHADRLRHPVYLGLRDDKNAAEVHGEG